MEGTTIDMGWVKVHYPDQASAVEHQLTRIHQDFSEVVGVYGLGECGDPNEVQFDLDGDGTWPYHTLAGIDVYMMEVGYERVATGQPYEEACVVAVYMPTT